MSEKELNQLIEHIKAFYFLLNTLLFKLDSLKGTKAYKHQLKAQLKLVESLLEKELKDMMSAFFKENNTVTQDILDKMEELADLVSKSDLNDLLEIRDGLINYYKQKEELV